MEPIPTTTASEGSAMMPQQPMVLGSEVRPLVGGFQFPAGGGQMDPAPPSYYQQTPATSTVTPATTTTTDQSTRRTSGDWESGTTTATATTARDTSKTTEQRTEHREKGYGPWLPAFMCVLVLLLVLFLVPYIFLSARVHGTPEPFAQRTRPPAKSIANRTRPATKGDGEPATPPRPPAGHIGGWCDSSSPCQGEGNCVDGVCHCDQPGTRVVDGVCVSAPAPTTEEWTTESPYTEPVTTKRRTTESTTTTEDTTTEATEPPTTRARRTRTTKRRPKSPFPTKRVETTAGSTLPPSIMFTFVRTVALRTRPKPRGLEMTTRLAPKVKPRGNATKSTKKPLKSKKKLPRSSVSRSIMASSSTGAKNRRARQE